MTTATLKLSDLDRTLQVRAALDGDTVEDYRALYEDGETLPPPVVYRDSNGRYYLADGYHRVRAAEALGIVSMPCDIRTGDRAAAAWFAVGANSKNGRRLSAGDTAHAIKIAVELRPDATQADIARQVGCSREYVNRVVKASVNKSHGGEPDERPSEGAIDGQDAGDSSGPDGEGTHERSPAGPDVGLAGDWEGVEDAVKTIADRAAYIAAMLPRLTAKDRPAAIDAVRGLAARLSAMVAG